MKKNIKVLIGVTVTLLFIFSGCKKYYFDSGTLDPKFNGNIMEYLEAKKPYFDSTITVIKLAGMENVLRNENVTFFAPPSGSIHKSVKRLNDRLISQGKKPITDLKQVNSQVWKNTLSEYIFAEKNLLKDYPQRDTIAYVTYPGQGYTSYSGRIMNIGVIYNDAGGVKYAGYRQLYLAYIPDFSNPQTGLVNIPVASSDIQPSNGVVHALNRIKHNFGFNTDTFIDQAIAAGITTTTN